MTHPFAPGDQVLAYLRDSGGDSQDASIAQQESEIRSWCAAEGLTLLHVYADAARPGSSTAGRDAFDALIRTLRSGETPARGIVIWRYSRFARDIDDAQFYKSDLRRRGYDIHALRDTIPQGAAGRIFETILDWHNEQFLADLSEDVKRGLRHNVQTYGVVPGTPPRGFRRSEPIIIGRRRTGQPRTGCRWEPDPDYLPRIRQAFALRAAKPPLAEIQRRVNLFGSINSWSTFFTNKLYIGILEFGGLVIENYCEPVVPQSDWDAVQRLIEQHRQPERLKTGSPGLHPRQVTSAYLLAGLARCARCGGPLIGHTSKKSYQRYECARRKRTGECDLPRIPAARLDAAVLAELDTGLLDPRLWRSLAAEMDAYRRNRDAELDAAGRDLRRQVGEHKRQIANITAAIAAAGHSPTLLAKLASLEREQTTLAERLAAIEKSRQSGPPPPPPDPETAIARIRERLASAALPDRQHVLRGLLQAVIVDRDDLRLWGELVWYFPEDSSEGSIRGERVGALPHTPLFRHRFERDIPPPGALRRQ